MYTVLVRAGTKESCCAHCLQGPIRSDWECRALLRDVEGGQEAFLFNFLTIFIEISPDAEREDLQHLSGNTER